MKKELEKRDAYYQCKGCIHLYEREGGYEEAYCYHQSDDVVFTGTVVDREWFEEYLDNWDLPEDSPKPAKDSIVAGVFCEYCYNDEWHMLDFPYKPARLDVKHTPEAGYICDGEACCSNDETEFGGYCYPESKLQFIQGKILCNNCAKKES